MVSQQRKAAMQEDIGPAPAYDFVSVYEGQWHSEIIKTAVDTEGNVYAAGEFSDTLKFIGHTLTDPGRRNIFLAKFNAAGSLLWMKQVTTAVEGCPLAKVNDLEVSGSAVFLSGRHSAGAIKVGNKELSAANPTFLAAYSTSGNFTWAVPSSSLSEPDNMVINANALFMAVGGVIMEYDFAGTLKNELTFTEGATITQLNLLGQDLLITGYIEENTLFGDVLLKKTGMYQNAFIARYNLAQRVFVWATTHNQQEDGSRPPNTNIITSVDIHDNHIYITGHCTFTSSLNWNGITLPELSGTLSYAAKFSSAGTPLWISEVPDNAYTTTSTKGTITGTNSLLVYSEYSKEGYWYDLEGNLQKTTPFSPLYNDLLLFNHQLYLGGSNDYKFILEQTDVNFATSNWQAVDEHKGGFNRLDGLEADKDGNLYHLGTIGGKTSIFKQKMEGDGLLLAKTTAQGEAVWTLLFENSKTCSFGRNIKISSTDGSIYFTGYSEQEFSIQSLTFTPQDGLTGFAAKVNTKGKVEWMQPIPYESSGIDVDSKGNVYVAGTYWNNFNINTITPPEALKHSGGFLLKLSPSGIPVWGQFYGGDDITFATFIAVDQNDNLYYTGEFHSRNLLLGNGETLTLGEEEGLILLAKLDTEGTIKWTKILGGGPEFWYTWPASIETTPQGNIVLNGWSAREARFGSITLNSPYRANHFVASISPDGSTLWAKIIKISKWGFNYNEMDVDTEGNVYVGGDFAESIEFEAGEGLTINDRAMYLAKYKADGSFAYAKTMEAESYNLMGGFAVVSPDKLYLNGTLNKARFDGSEFSASAYSGFLLKLEAALPNGIKEPLLLQTVVNIYPNPTSEQLIIALSEPAIAPIKIVVYDTNGKKVRSFSLNTSHKNITLPIQNLKKGMYLIQLSSGKGSTTKRFIKN